MLHEKLKIIDKSGRTSLLEIDQSKLKFVGSDGISQWVLLSKEGGVLSIDKDIQVGNTTLSKQIGAADADSGGYLQIKESATNWVGFKAAGMFIHGSMELKGNLGSKNGQNGDLYVNNLHAKTISCSGELEVSNSITADTIKASSIDADTLIESDTISAGSIDASTSIEATTITAISSIQAGSSITAKRGSIKATNGDITASNGTISAGGSISAGTITSDGMTADGDISLGTIESGGRIGVILKPRAAAISDAAVVQYDYSRYIDPNNMGGYYEKLDALITGYVGDLESYMRCLFRNVTDLNLCFLLDTIPGITPGAPSGSTPGGQSSIKGMEREFGNNAKVPDGYFLLTSVFFNKKWIRIPNAKVVNKNDPRTETFTLLGICNNYTIIINYSENRFEWAEGSPITKIKGVTFKITTTYQ